MNKSRASYKEPVSASAPKSSKQGRLRSITIDTTENGGFVGSCRHDETRSKSGMSCYEPPKTYAFADRKSLDTWLDGLIGVMDNND